MRRIRKWLSDKLYDWAYRLETWASAVETDPDPIPWEQMDEVQRLAHTDANRLASSMPKLGTRSAWMDAINAGKLQISPHETVHD